MRHGPGPRKRSRGTAAKAARNADERIWVVNRNSSAKARRASSTGSIIAPIRPPERRARHRPVPPIRQRQTIASRSREFVVWFFRIAKTKRISSGSLGCRARSRTAPVGSTTRPTAPAARRRSQHLEKIERSLHGFWFGAQFASVGDRPPLARSSRSACMAGSLNPPAGSATRPSSPALGLEAIL